MPVILHTTEATPHPGHRLALRFDIGEAGVVDLSEELEGEVFAPLKDPVLFATARQHPAMKTAAWENRADLAPEFLLDLMQAQWAKAA